MCLTRRSTLPLELLFHSVLHSVINLNGKLLFPELHPTLEVGIESSFRKATSQLNVRVCSAVAVEACSLGIQSLVSSISPAYE